VSNPHPQARTGLLLGLSAYFFWGFLPLYFKLLVAALPSEVVAHRVIWSLFLLGALIVATRRWHHLRSAITSPKLLLILGASALLIATNWLVYIFAVVNDHVLEASLGYYLNPLVNVLLGVVLLKERLTRAQSGAVLLAAAGVALLALGAGQWLWISLMLAGTFALYGFIRKVAPVDALEGLTIETLLLAPLSIAWLLWLAHQGKAALGTSLTLDVLLILSGAITALPLLLFTAAAKRLPYSTLGFLQYIAPSLQFLIAVVLLGETLTPTHILCFAAIWTALVIFAIEGARLGRAAARRRVAGAT
jgi:chloramphenicol-sensitive protein RarD